MDNRTVNCRPGLVVASRTADQMSGDRIQSEHLFFSKAILGCNHIENDATISQCHSGREVKCGSEKGWDLPGLGRCGFEPCARQ